ncbi:MAG: tetratricopeptide repeat protein [Gammaproteobacteria bacterium]|nr:tetratricopeptide repeat protein [Gammaproteobacteria bacterium]
MTPDNLIKQAAEALQRGDFPTADELLVRTLKRKPRDVDAMNLAGVLAYHQGDYPRAIAMLKRVVKRQPAHAGAHLNLGAALNATRQYAGAEFHYQSALKLNPNNHVALCNLGKNCFDQNKHAEARRYFLKTIAKAPDYAIAHHNLAACLLRQGEYEEAVGVFSKALALSGTPETLSELVGALRRTSRFDEEYAAALQLLNSDASADLKIAAFETLLDAGDWASIEDHRIDLLDALDSPRSRAECCGPGLLILNCLPTLAPDLVARLHRRWAERIIEQGVDASLAVQPRADGGTLRVGLVSPDFRDHSVALFLRHVLPEFDTSRFEIHCYANQRGADDVTHAIAADVTSFRHVYELSDAELAQVIRGDGIDILVDLAGHTRDNRLSLFAQRLATVQLTWLGYPNTTGLETMDYRITDAVADAGPSTVGTEALAFMPDAFLCFGRFEDVAVAPLPPCAERGTITFGSFNNIRKITPRVIALWSRILAAVPDSRLVIKSRRATDTITASNLRRMFQSGGIEPLRIELRPATDTREEHLAAYNDIDIALDTFPYSGTTTTCEALWMGVPVVTLLGHAHAQRVSASILTSIGHTELITDASRGYVDAAVSLARDSARLADYRAGLRSTLERSVLCQPDRYTRQLETLLQSLWQEKSGNSAPPGLPDPAITAR